MKFLRYKALSQQVDTAGLYNNLTLLNDLYMVNDYYFIFFKHKTKSEFYFTKESFAGSFNAFKAIITGVPIDRFELLKCYNFRKLPLNLFIFKVNSDQFLTILEQDGEVSFMVDSTDDTKTVNFINTSCPIHSTKSGDSQTLYSFNSHDDGSNSSVLYSTDVDQNSGLSASKLDDALSIIEYSTTVFNSLILDTGGTTLGLTYSNLDDTIYPYVRSLTTFNTAVNNQILDNTTSLTLIDISVYLDVGYDHNNPLVFATNNIQIYYNPDTSVYTYKNLIAYHDSSDFTSAEVFGSNTRYHLFKDKLRIFFDVTEFDNLAIGKIESPTMRTYIDSDINISGMASIAYESRGSYFDNVQSYADIISITNVEQLSEIVSNNYEIN